MEENMAKEGPLSINEKQARLISTHNIVPMNRGYRDGDAEKAFARSQGKIKSSPVQEYRAETEAEKSAADAKVDEQNVAAATVNESVEKKTEAKQSRGKKTAEPADEDMDEG
jgi:hypothetical protein